MSVMTDNGIWSLKKARRQLDAAHREACNALACFDTDRADNSLPVEARIAARSLLGETVELCKHLMDAMNSIPEAAQQKAAQIEPPEACGLKPAASRPCIRTAKSLLDGFRAKRGPLADSVNYGQPICSAIH